MKRQMISTACVLAACASLMAERQRQEISDSKCVDDCVSSTDGVSGFMACVEANCDPSIQLAMAEVGVIRDMVMTIHDNLGGIYPVDLIDAVVGMYSREVKDPMVFHYYREQSLALLCDMFDLNVESRDDPEKASWSNEERVRRYLHPDGATLLRSRLTAFLGEAKFLEKPFDGLLWGQRRRLLYMAKHILTSEDKGAIDILERYAGDPNVLPDGRRDIDVALARIKRQ